MQRMRNLSKHSGFTLIEVMIVVVIIGILASIAYPSYTRYVAEGARAEALSELMRIANLQEQYYLDFRSYTDDMTKLGLAADPFVTERDHYSIDATVAGASFTLTATAKGSQASRDGDCTPLTLTSTGAKNKPECW
ncbi:MAG: type IV pilin protein [Shewanella sp.]|nr:type IV pilin protein [Shewanella sp.]MCF1430968.1 type IV pilin protein [Shewanella sp.]MCF1438023.1 type IV pilin protein [Shewanella sp.]MCF1459391.1 type IV pilin protein [Shewanella sp.]